LVRGTVVQVGVEMAHPHAVVGGDEVVQQSTEALCATRRSRSWRWRRRGRWVPSRCRSSCPQRCPNSPASHDYCHNTIVASPVIVSLLLFEAKLRKRMAWVTPGRSGDVLEASGSEPAGKDVV